MNSSEKRKERKRKYVEGMTRRFYQSRNEFVRDNSEVDKLKEVDGFFGFHGNYLNGLVHKHNQKRGIPSWIFPHMNIINRLKSKSNRNYSPFNLHYVLFDEREDPEKAMLYKKISEQSKEIEKLKKMLRREHKHI